MILQTLTAWRAAPIWYLAALLLPLIVSAAGIALLALLGQPLPPWPRTEPLPALLPLLLSTFVATLLYGGPLGEEIGWRGFALPRLQAQHSPLVASLLLSVVWGSGMCRSTLWASTMASFPMACPASCCGL